MSPARLRLLAAVACVTSHALIAQPVLDPLGGGVGTFGVYRMEADSLDQKLYIGGGFGLVEDSLFPAITAWNGTGYERLGCGLHNGPWDCVTSWNGSGTGPVTDIEFWNSELYTCGAFSHSGQTSMSRIARWDGTTWQPMGLGADLTVVSLRSLSDGLYAAHLRLAAAPEQSIYAVGQAKRQPDIDNRANGERANAAETKRARDERADPCEYRRH